MHHPAGHGNGWGLFQSARLVAHESLESSKRWQSPRRGRFDTPVDSTYTLVHAAMRIQWGSWWRIGSPCPHPRSIQSSWCLITI